MHPFRRLVRVLIVTTPLALLVAGCGHKETDADLGASKGVLYRSIGPEAKTIDPQRATGTNEASIVEALFEGLVSPDPKDLHPLPGIAKSWDIDATRTRYTFHLRKDARWSDGSPLTAGDFVASYQRILSPAFGSKNAYLLFVLKGARAFTEGKLKNFSQVGVRALDPHTLQLTLENPTPYFLSLLTHWAWFPVPVKTIAKYGSVTDPVTNWTKPGRLVGDGPFILKTRRFNLSTRVVRNPDYWDVKNVHLNAIVFSVYNSVDSEAQAFRAGQIQITDALPIGKIPFFRQHDPKALRISDYLGTYFYRFNVTNPVLKDPRVRRALAMAVNRKAICKNLLGGGQQPAHAFTPPNTAGYTPEVGIPTDPARARKLLAEAGYPGGKGFPTLNILYNSSENHRLIAEAIQEMWRRELGIKTNLVNQELAVYLDNRSHLNYDICRSSWIGDYVDPSTFLEVFSSDSGNNQTGWKNAEYDALLQQAAREPDQKKRYALFQQAEAILVKQAPIIPIFYYTHAALIDPRIKGWYNNILDRHPYKYVYFAPNT